MKKLTYKNLAKSHKGLLCVVTNNKSISKILRQVTNIKGLHEVFSVHTELYVTWIERKDSKYHHVNKSKGVFSYAFPLMKLKGIVIK